MTDVIDVFTAAPPGVELLVWEDRDAWLRMRHRDVTASAISALFGVNPYQSAFALWAEKSGKSPPSEAENEAMERGRLLEPVAVQLLKRERKNWRVVYPVDRYYRDTAARIGATPDCFAINPERPGFGNVQIKSVEASVFRRKWTNEEGKVEPPLGYAVQSSIEAALTGASWACVAAIVMGFGVELHIVDVPEAPDLLAEAKARVREFWQRVEQGDPYHPNYAKDGAIIANMFAKKHGEPIDLTGDNYMVELLSQREALKAREKDGKDAETARKALDAEILMKLGEADCARVFGDRLLTVSKVNRKAYSVEASSYLQIGIKAEKKNV